jgi:DNA polymerase III subunit delta'
MSPFPDFYGNESVAQTLSQMIERRRIGQTIILSGPEGVGKATLVRRFASALLGDKTMIERDDLSLPQNIDAIEEREKWTADKRNDDPLLFSTHPDFLTFPPEGPLRQITIQQMRLLRQRAQFKPLKGERRVFLIDHLDRANEQAANSLLKVLEEPPEHLVIIATAENLYEVLPTIRSRSVILTMARLSESDMLAFVRSRGVSDLELRVAVSEGCPGVAARLDLDLFRARRGVVLAAFECSAGIIPFSSWVQQSEAFSAKKSEKLDPYIALSYYLLDDILAASYQRPILRNRDVQPRVAAITERVTFAWLEQAVRLLDELQLMVRRNIQKIAALDAMIVKLRNQPRFVGT